MPKGCHTQGMARPLQLEFTDASYEITSAEPDQAITAAYSSGGYSMREIGDFFGPHYSRVSKIVRSFRAANAKETGKT